jgi:hypothetical protein
MTRRKVTRIPHPIADAFAPEVERSAHSAHEPQQPAAHWIVWQLAPDSDPEERYILTSPDGQIEHPLNLKFSSGVEACNFLKNNPQHDSAASASESAPVIPSSPWGEGRRAFILTDAQAELVADALEIVSPNDERLEEEAQALAVQFRSRA